jgi:hypothetical protein
MTQKIGILWLFECIHIMTLRKVEEKKDRKNLTKQENPMENYTEFRYSFTYIVSGLSRIV